MIRLLADLFITAYMSLTLFLVRILLRCVGTNRVKKLSILYVLPDALFPFIYHTK